MKGKLLAIMIMLLMSTVAFSVAVNGAGVGAGETITTNKQIYVLGEPVYIHVHGENYTYYELVVDGENFAGIYTNATGYANVVYSSLDFGTGTHKLDLELNNKVTASTSIEIRTGLQLWPSVYTHTNTYYSEEKMWVKLTAAPNETYRINITNPNGSTTVYPVNNNTFSVHTDNSGIAIFNITLGMGDGSYRINLYNSTSYIQARYFSVESVEIVASVDKGRNGVYLLSEKMHVYVSVYWLKNHTLIQGAQYRYWIVNANNPSITFGPYISDKSDFYTYTLDSYSTQSGAKIHPNEKYQLKIEYESGTGYGKHMATVEIPFYTGTLHGTVDLHPIDNSFSPGNRVGIEMNSYAVYANLKVSPVPDVNINFINITITDFWSIQWTKNITDFGATDISGSAYLIWSIPTVPAGSKLTVTVGFSLGNIEYTAYAEEWISGNEELQLTTDKDTYISGETMTIHMYTEQPSNVNNDGYDVWVYTYNGFTNENLLYYTSATKNTVSYRIPLNFSGRLAIYAKAHFSTGAVAYAQALVHVTYGKIYLSASQYTYMHAGEEIEIYSEFSSNVMHPQYLHYIVKNDHNQIIEEKNASAGEFLFTVPNMDSTYYKIIAEATYHNYRVFNSITITEFEGYMISAHIVTKSKYQNLVYEPGQSIKISYSIEKIGDFQPHLMLLHWAILNTNYTGVQAISPDETQGSISIKLPTDLRGGCIIMVWVTDSDNHLSTTNYMAISIEKGTWSMENVAGMPLLSLINLILVIVAIIIGIVAILLFIKGRNGGAPPEEEEEHKEEEPEPAPQQKKSKSFFPGKKKKGPPKPFEPPQEQPEEPTLPHEEDEIGEI
ncbi:MAG: hypothetical protein GXO25_03020 [Euryarchaeota archaeon]|nr:hypothetical protein [Euryarchaeota archaeon]